MRRVSTYLNGAAGGAKRGDPEPEKGLGFSALGGGDPRAESNGSDGFCLLSGALASFFSSFRKRPPFRMRRSRRSTSFSQALQEGPEQKRHECESQRPWVGVGLRLR